MHDGDYLELAEKVLRSESFLEQGFCMASGMRQDVQAEYIQLIVRVARYAKDGADIMIKNGWMEKPPQIADRKILAGQ